MTSSQDEVAIRMGIAGGLTAASAENYPGVGGRTAANDGHFVSVDVTLLPEPGTGLLFGLGLLFLARCREKR